jgi:hypothetical protein
MHGHEPHVILTGECFLMKGEHEYLVKKRDSVVVFAGCFLIYFQMTLL